MQAFIDKHTIGPWPKHPNLAFDGSTPIQAIERGKSDRLWRMLSQLESRAPA